MCGMILHALRPCLHGGGGLQVGEVTRLSRGKKKKPTFTCSLTILEVNPMVKFFFRFPLNYSSPPLFLLALKPQIIQLSAGRVCKLDNVYTTKNLFK